jgi:hypothetical protein
MYYSDYEKAPQEDVRTPRDNVKRLSTQEVNDARINRFTLKQQGKIIWRIDRRLVLTLGLLYCTSLMDRINLSSAAIAGFVIPCSFLCILEFGLILVFLEIGCWRVSI